MKIKGLVLSGLTVLLASTLVGCSSNSSDSKPSKKSSETKTEKVEKPKKVKTSSDAKNSKWTFKNDTYDAGILTYKFTKSEIRPSIDEGKNVLVLYTDVTNNSKKDQDPSNVFITVHAEQKTETANKELLPGTAQYDDNGDDPLQTYNDALNDKLLPGKTTHAVIVFELENTNPVKLVFSDYDFSDIGSKTYNVAQ